VVEHADVVVIGSGFAGIGMGIKLKESGRHDFVILEKDTDLGGTWRDNTYPGCTCDVPSYLYSFSFEQNPDWTRLFSPQDEIWAYLRHCVDTYDLAQHLRFDSAVTRAAYDETTRRWKVEVDGRDQIDTRVVVSAVGGRISRDFPTCQADTFKGTAFHSAHWRHDHDLTGRKVAVIGTGASAVQFVPQIAPASPTSTSTSGRRRGSRRSPNPRIAADKQQLYRRHPLRQRVARDFVYWLLDARGIGFALTPRAMGPLEQQARRHLARQVSDPDLRAALTPDYQIGCKRILLSSDFYPAVTRDNVELFTADRRSQAAWNRRPERRRACRRHDHLRHRLRHQREPDSARGHRPRRRCPG
jgi:cation diffusion facilitator CzcD-associated flavoprotein CzcO